MVAFLATISEEAPAKPNERHQWPPEGALARERSDQTPLRVGQHANGTNQGSSINGMVQKDVKEILENGSATREFVRSYSNHYLGVARVVVMTDNLQIGTVFGRHEMTWDDVKVEVETQMIFDGWLAGLRVCL